MMYMYILSWCPIIAFSMIGLWMISEGIVVLSKELDKLRIENHTNKLFNSHNSSILDDAEDTKSYGIILNFRK